MMYVRYPFFSPFRRCFAPQMFVSGGGACNMRFAYVVVIVCLTQIQTFRCIFLVIVNSRSPSHSHSHIHTHTDTQLNTFRSLSNAPQFVFFFFPHFQSVSHVGISSRTHKHTQTMRERARDREKTHTNFHTVKVARTYAPFPIRFSVSFQLLIFSLSEHNKLSGCTITYTGK